jgi:plasmid stabilization system protein ParE
MAYKLIVSKRAQIEIIKSIEFYESESNFAPAWFVQELESTYKTLIENPNQKVRYKSVMSIKIKRFPFDLYFIVNEEKKQIRVLSCFHQKRNPSKRPRN